MSSKQAVPEGKGDKVGRLFEEAREVPPDERAAFLQERCEEEALRREVLSLLEAHRESTGFFEDLAEGVVAPAFGELRAEVEEAEEAKFSADDPLDLEGTRVGRYAVEKLLGGGGMGVVYRARDPQLDRPVALKFLPPYLAASEEAKRRFVREAKAASALDHSHIATIYEIGEAEEGRRFIAMAYYEGKTLKEKLAREGPLPIEDALRYAEQITEALAEAHEAGIVHRDVKPANVMVTEAGEVKLLDFGLAKAAAETHLTEPGRRLGTAAYMSPEQAEGEEVDARTDLWALGALLYEMLAGERPFQGERPPALLRSILDDEPPPLGEKREEMPPALEKVVKKCLQKDPEGRYASAEALAEDLRALWSETRSVSTGAQPTGDTRLGIWSRRGLVGAAMALLLAVGIALSWTFWPNGGAEEGGPSGGPPPSPSVAVLPFEDRGAGKKEALGAGFTGAIIAELAAVEGLVVVSQSSVMQYQDTNLSLSKVADCLRVEYVLDGRIRQAGDRIRVVTELVDAETGRVRWARRFERPMSGIFEVQSEVALQVAEAVGGKLAPAVRKQIAKRPTSNEAAYRLYLRAQELLSETEGDPNPEEAHSAIELLRQAVRLDSTFVLAQAALAGAFADRGDEGSVSRWDDSARVAAQRAAELGPQLAETYFRLGDTYRDLGKTNLARQALKRALKLKPAHGWATFNLGYLAQVHEGRWAAALPWHWRALSRLPEHPYPRAAIGYVMLGFGEDSAAVAWRRRTVELGSPFFIHHLLQGDLARGDLKAARRHLERYQAWDADHPRVLQWSGLLAQLSGDTTRALRFYRRAQHRHSAFPVMNVDPQVRRAHLLRARGREPLADSLLQAAIRRSRRTVEAGHEWSLPRFRLAAAYRVAGDSAAARRWLDAAYRAGARHHRDRRKDPVWRGVGYAQAVFDRMAEDLAAQKKKAKAWAEVEGIEWPPMPEDRPPMEDPDRGEAESLEREE